MTAILVHIGCTGPYITSTRPPAHLFDCMEQYRLFNASDLYILTDRENLPHLPAGDGVHTFAIEDYHSPKVSRFESLYNYKPREFWTVTFTRLIYIENFLREQGICHICEFANDVLVYTNLDSLPFNELYHGLAITPCGPQHVLDGFMWIEDWLALAHLTQFFVDTLARLGIEGIIRQYKYDMVNEMTMMHLYSQEVGFGGYLPILPSGEWSTNFDKFGSLFDPATYGQYVAGTQVSGPGIKATNHWVGHVLNAHPEWDVEWRPDGKSLVPYLNHFGKLTRLNNLHIHSKNMRRYRSDRDV